MALKVGNTIIIQNNGQFSWNNVKDVPANTIVNVTVTGTGTTAVRVTANVAGVWSFVKTNETFTNCGSNCNCGDGGE